MNNYIFVFGSNEAGIHGAGAARTAYEKYGAVIGKGFGHYGNSFAIPTKDERIETLPIAVVSCRVQDFIDYANKNPNLKFQVTRIGCGLAGFTDHEVAPMFVNAPSNCYFDTMWSPYLKPDAKFWGTF